MALRFQFNEQPLRIKDAKRADPQAIGEALSKLSAAHGDRLKKQHVVDEAAKSKKGVLGRHLDWDDVVAANSWRLEQAGELIRCIVRINDDRPDDKPRRAYLSINEGDGTAYRRVDEVLDSEELQLIVMRSALRDLKAWEERYSDLSDICSLVKIARIRAEKKVEQAEERQKSKRNSSKQRRKAA